jgi:hypothetical protein
MRNFIITMAAGLVVALTTGTVIAGEHERREGRGYEHSDRYESKIYGPVQRLPKDMIGTWEVNGKEVNVTKSTIIKEKHGKAEVGAYVEVEGTFSGKTLNAYKIEVKRSGREGQKIYGTIEKIPAGNDGLWMVNGVEVTVTRDTIIKERQGKAEVGAYVEVEGSYSENKLVAHEIKVKRAGR